MGDNRETSPQALYSNLHETQYEIDHLRQEIDQKVPVIQRLEKDIQYAEEQAVALEKQLFAERMTYASVMEKRHLLEIQIADEKQKQYSSHLQLISVNEEKKSLEAKHLCIASGHANRLTMLAKSRLSKIEERPSLSAADTDSKMDIT
eukprot:scaffold4247_cov174-Ochromonas_danica.AAC.5